MDKTKYKNIFDNISRQRVNIALTAKYKDRDLKKKEKCQRHTVLIMFLYLAYIIRNVKMLKKCFRFTTAVCSWWWKDQNI